MPTKHSTKRPPKQAHSPKRADSPPARNRAASAKPKTAGQAGGDQRSVNTRAPQGDRPADASGPHASASEPKPYWEAFPGWNGPQDEGDLLARVLRYRRPPTKAELCRRLSKRHGDAFGVEDVLFRLIRAGHLRCTNGVFWLPPRPSLPTLSPRRKLVLPPPEAMHGAADQFPGSDFE
jgi:hypothetical protein